MLKAYIEDRKGNFSIMFAFMATVLIMGVGIAIDISSAHGQRSKLQDFADSAVLAAAVSGEQNEDELQIIATDSANSNNFTGLTLDTQLTITESNALSVTVSASVKPFLLNIFGRDSIDIEAKAEAPPKGNAPLNLALVLDSTQSMDGTKITALRTAANDLLDTLEGGNGNVQISVVPFAEYVKLPMTYEHEPWLNAAPAQNECWTETDYSQSVNCTTTWVDETSTETCDIKVEVPVCQLKEYEGCMGSRQAPHHLTADYNGVALEGFSAGTWCHSTVQPLTSNFTDVRSAITDMNTWQHTYIPSGLIWGWRSLTPQAPMTEANTTDLATRASAMILMSDGANTVSVQSPGSMNIIDPQFEGRFHWNTDEDDANTVTSTLCNNIKNDGITIYAIALEVSDATTINLLRNCASSPANFYDATDTSGLATAFEDIGEKLAQVRLSK